MTCKSIVFILCCLFLSSCAGPKHLDRSRNEDEDLACSYFYFLWGTHAEFHRQYPEALEAYEKALICDPQAEYVEEKLPLLLLKMGKDEKAAALLRNAITSNPENNNFRLFLANIYVRQNKTADAIKLYNQVLKKTPDNEEIQLRLGLLYAHLNQLKAAGKIFRHLISQNNDSYFPRLYLARLLVRSGKNSEASIEYEKALTLNWSKDLAYEIAHFYTSIEKFEDTLRIITTITENDHLDERAALSRIQALLDLSRDDEALKELKILKATSGTPAKIDIIISKVLLKKNDIAGAQTILQRLSKKTQNSAADYLLALLAYQKNDFTGALRYLAPITSKDVEFEDAVYLQSRIFRKEGKQDEAIAILKKYISEDSTRSPLFYALLSMQYQDKGENSAATEIMKTAVTLYPANYQLYFEYGLLLEKNGMSKHAMKAMKKVLELQPNHADALNFIGYTWADENINLDRALDYIQRAIKLKPNNGYIVDSLGWVFYRLGKLDKAVTQLKRSIQLEPGDPHIYDHLGDVYRSQKNSLKALETYNKAYQLFTDKKKKAVLKKKIKALEKK